MHLSVTIVFYYGKNKMLEGLSREIQKLKIRLEDYLKEKEELAKELKECIRKFDRLDNALEKSRRSINPPENVEELMELRLNAVAALSKVLKRESTVEHEKSHLLESYGTLIMSLEEEFKKLKLC